MNRNVYSIFKRSSTPFYATVFLTAALDVAHGRFPVWALSYLIGYQVWPRLAKVRSTPWTLLAFLLVMAALFALSIATGVLMLPGFIFGLATRGLSSKGSARARKSAN